MSTWHKYNAKKTVVDGVTFDSTAEARRYGELKLLERAGEILNLELQPVFVLQDGFKGQDGKRVRAVKYIADFRYFDVGTSAVVVEDVKGMETAVFRLKRKIFWKQYPEIDLRIVN